MNNTTYKVCPCGSPRLMTLEGNSNYEPYNITLDGLKKRNVIIPSHCNMGDYGITSFTVCLNCGRIQGEWPIRYDIGLTKGYTDNDNVTPEVKVVKQSDSKMVRVRIYDIEKHLYIDLVHDLLIFSTKDIKPMVVGYLLNGKPTPLTEELKTMIETDYPGTKISDSYFDDTIATQSKHFETMKVVPYDKERHLYIELEHNLLIYFTAGKAAVVIGFFLNGNLLPLTDELKAIIATDYCWLSTSNRLFDRHLKDDIQVTKASSQK